MFKSWEKPAGLIAKHNIKAEIGLLAPSGELFECAYGGHASLCRTLTGDDGGRYELYGFIHVDTSVDKPDFAPTQAQIDTIFEWCVLHKCSLPYWTGLSSASKKADESEQRSSFWKV